MSTDPAAAPADEDAPAPQAAAAEDATPPEHGAEEAPGEGGATGTEADAEA
ncbi:dihydrolipoamide succinyltransferase, partial [Streptomyces sp. SID8014]|nr:dihydrolipoamide succinyltransferase [Streptomyces sp. SID8014]